MYNQQAMLGLSEITNWKDFERLCADLLAGAGFEIKEEPHVDRSGVDFVAVETYHSHDPGRTIRIRWRVQCKHFQSGANLGRKEIEEILVAFEATRAPDEGLFVIVSTDYTEPASSVVDRYIQRHPSVQMTLWNGRHLLTQLDRHPHLLERYGIAPTKSSFVSHLRTLSELAEGRVLLISDQSALAHNLGFGLRQAGFDVSFVPFWNYQDPVRLDLVLRAADEFVCQIIICFLGDSFGVRMPRTLTDFVVRKHRAGVPLLFFPFLAWSIDRGFYHELESICPVRLADPKKFGPELIERVQGAHRRGNFSWLLAFDSFAEDEYCEVDPVNGVRSFTEGITSRFGLSHSFEYLVPVPGATVMWTDVTGNPMAVVNDGAPARVCYLNTCCHACMSNRAVLSPLEVSREFPMLLRNALAWLLAKETPDP